MIGLSFLWSQLCVHGTPGSCTRCQFCQNVILSIFTSISKKHPLRDPGKGDPAQGFNQILAKLATCARPWGVVHAKLRPQKAETVNLIS